MAKRTPAKTPRSPDPDAFKFEPGGEGFYELLQVALLVQARAHASGDETAAAVGNVVQTLAIAWAQGDCEAITAAKSWRAAEHKRQRLVGLLDAAAPAREKAAYFRHVVLEHLRQHGAPSGLEFLLARDIARAFPSCVRTADRGVVQAAIVAAFKAERFKARDRYDADDAEHVLDVALKAAGMNATERGNLFKARAQADKRRASTKT